MHTCMHTHTHTHAHTHTHTHREMKEVFWSRLQKLTCMLCYRLQKWTCALCNRLLKLVLCSRLLNEVELGVVLETAKGDSGVV